MRRNVREDIRNLQNDVLQLEDRVLEFLRSGYNEGVQKSLAQLDNDLKYLSILANGAPIDKKEDRKIMDFLRTHYTTLRKLSLPA